jgi:hypothetical protein
MRRIAALGAVLAIAIGCGPGKDAARAEVMKAYQDYAAAVWSGDLMKVLPFRSGVTPSNTKSSPEQERLALALLQANVPRDARATGADVQGDDAALIVKGTGVNGKPVEVWVTMAREGGRWKVVKETLNLQAK